MSVVLVYPNYRRIIFTNLFLQTLEEKYVLKSLKIFQIYKYLLRLIGVIFWVHYQVEEIRKFKDHVVRSHVNSAGLWSDFRNIGSCIRLICRAIHLVRSCLGAKDNEA